uniref:Uncharacterized protein n=1 Tax=Lepeophtheirus salmonis TaxID=72036 RepID=A0A0K2UVI7_LEPSM
MDASKKMFVLLSLNFISNLFELESPDVKVESSNLIPISILSFFSAWMEKNSCFWIPFKENNQSLAWIL